MTKQKHVVITGASSGLGASLSKIYNDSGYFVTLIGRNEKRLTKIVSTFKNKNYSIKCGDITSYEAVNEIFEKINDQGLPVDILINNAGVGYFNKLGKISEKEISEMIDVNLKGTIYCTQKVLKTMKSRNFGSIINVISTAGIEGKVDETVYCASKYGVRGFTESLITELKDTGIQIHGIYMSGMNTPFWEGTLNDNQKEKFMSPNDVADMIKYNTELRDNMSMTDIVIENM